ncbi:hypothetical protein [Pseudodesulfovibrio karagichevae]|uniref:Uncharacterized protein n=1 Tax=Pseudodesulfovibrio karagichevae TaxID=3239305 RepID=A0ABV4K3M4_9BACT
MSLIGRIWRGEEGLGLTFWGYGLGANLLFSMIMLMTLQLRLPIWAFSAVFLFRLVYMVFISVGIWRSAGRYTGNQAWAFLAKLMVIIGYINVFLSLGRGA